MREKQIERYDVVIIGGGPSGLTAAIYCGRARLKTILIEKALIGGLATYTSEVENYPGFINKPKGEDITNLMKKHAEDMGCKIKLTAVQSVDLTQDIKRVETFRTTYEAKAVIISTGGRPRVTGAPNEESFLFDKGISFCATCDAAQNTGKHVVVIGSGDAAIEEGIFLTKFASKVTVSVLHDKGIMDCNEIAKDAALHNPKMEFIWNTIVDHFEGDERLHTVHLKNVKTGEVIPVACDSCFEFIGYIPNSELFKDQITLTKRGYIPTNEKMETNLKGVFACGDIREKWLRQIATAVGDGAVAACAAEKFIAEEEHFQKLFFSSDKPVIASAVQRRRQKFSRMLVPMQIDGRRNGRHLFFRASRCLQIDGHGRTFWRHLIFPPWSSSKTKKSLIS
ncbi:MAG: FAD-dependent oxidoreductase [Bacillus subtilis]|nr:FAD-dependent oxidoreductase [Bacillus subtilis]